MVWKRRFIYAVNLPDPFEKKITDLFKGSRPIKNIMLSDLKAESKKSLTVSLKCEWYCLSEK